MTTDLLKKLQALPASSRSQGPIASLLALEEQRHNDPKWAALRREAKLADRRRALMRFALVVLVGAAFLAMPYVVPGLVASISMFVEGYFGALCAVAVIGMLSGNAVLQSWSELPAKWAGALLCSCLLAGSVAVCLLLVAGINMLDIGFA